MARLRCSRVHRLHARSYFLFHGSRSDAVPTTWRDRWLAIVVAIAFAVALGLSIRHGTPAKLRGIALGWLSSASSVLAPPQLPLRWQRSSCSGCGKASCQQDSPAALSSSLVPT
jgi:hypothetical protein